MDLEHEFEQQNRFYHPSRNLKPNHGHPAIDNPPQSVPPNPQYIKNLIERLLEHDPRRKIIERALYRFFTEDLFGGELVKLFLMALYRKNCRINTLKIYITTFIQFIRFLKKTGHKSIETVTRNDLCAFVENEQDRGLKPKSVSTRYRHICAFMRFLVNESIVHSNILERKIRIKIPELLPRAIDPEDIKKLLSVIQKPRDLAMILLLLRTGMRIGELLSTRVSDINLKEKRIEIYEAQKNRVGRVVYFSEDAAQALKKWLKTRDDQQVYLFYGRKNRPLTYETARHRYKILLDQAGLGDKEYTLHCLRHTFASELLNAGMRLECLQPLLGHKSVEVTRIYARLTDNTRKEEYFKAMSIIEKGGVHGTYRFDHQLP